MLSWVAESSTYQYISVKFQVFKDSEEIKKTSMEEIIKKDMYNKWHQTDFTKIRGSKTVENAIKFEWKMIWNNNSTCSKSINQTRK